MKKQPDQDRKAEASGKTSSRVGAKEVLTQELARRIALMVSQFPDANIAVTWDNVAQQTKLRFGREFHRNVLSQKAWGGRKLVAEAFKHAKAIQSRLGLEDERYLLEDDSQDGDEADEKAA